jgi:hypothetical protein
MRHKFLVPGFFQVEDGDPVIFPELYNTVRLQRLQQTKGCAFHVSGTVREIIERYIVS